MAIVKAIISGGQTGADQGGLLAAKELGISTGGIAPAGWKTEAGPAKWLEEYGLMESDSPDYADRTEENVRLADGTAIFGRRSVGSNKTEECCRVLGKPCVWIWWPLTIDYIPQLRIAAPNGLRVWIARYSIGILNVAGNRESKNPGIGKFTKDFLVRAFK